MRPFSFYYLRRAFNRPHFRTRNVQIGKGVRFGMNVRFHCDSVRIGDGCVFRDNVLVESTEFVVGDFGTFYQGVFAPGPGKLQIGHNCWFGKDAIIDSQGDVQIGNNVGIGAGVQLWSHSQFGNKLAGAQAWHARGLGIGDDSWIGPGAQIGPVHIAPKTMVLMGSVVTKNTISNHPYAGNPAVDIIDKMGPVFTAVSIQERHSLFQKKIEEFNQISETDVHARIKTVKEFNSGKPATTEFNLNTLEYRKTGSKLERKLIRFMLPDLKFTPA